MDRSDCIQLTLDEGTLEGFLAFAARQDAFVLATEREYDLYDSGAQPLTPEAFDALADSYAARLLEDASWRLRYERAWRTVEVVER